MIHKTAVIDSQAKLDENVSVGPFSVIGPNVSIGAGTVVGPHVVINGHTTIGKGNRFFQFGSIGEENQDKKYNGEPTQTIIGDNNVFRECCTIHRGTVQDIGYTKIGNDCLFMAYTHIAHDCIVGDHVIFANNASIAGHVQIGDWVILGGFTGVHQFCKIGSHAFSGMNSRISQDVPPFILLQDGVPRAINSEGLKRRGFTPERLKSIKNAFRTVYRKGIKLDEALAQLQLVSADDVDTQEFIQFIQSSTRGIVR